MWQCMSGWPPQEGPSWLLKGMNAKILCLNVEVFVHPGFWYMCMVPVDLLRSCIKSNSRMQL